MNKRKPEPVNWGLIERLTLRSFQGHPISELEMSILQDAYNREPDLYKEYTNNVREEERRRIKSY